MNLTCVSPATADVSYLDHCVGSTRLASVAERTGGEQPVVFDATKRRMANIPEYAKTADADNARIFKMR